jgi:hypothetical protein
MWVVLMCGMQSFATTPIEAYIARMKTTNQFVVVSDIWQADNSLDKKELQQYVDDAQPLQINYANVGRLMQQRPLGVSLVIPGTNGRTFVVELGKYDIFSGDFQVGTRGEDGRDKPYQYTPGLYYSGTLSGYPGSVAAFSFFNNEVYGMFSIPNEGNFVLVPNSMKGKDYDYNQSYLLYNDALLKIKNDAPGCATDQLPMLKDEENSFAAKTTTFLNKKMYNSCTNVRVYEVADYDFYTKRGSNVTNVTNYMTALFNNQATIYRNEGIPIVLKYVQVNTASDVYMTITSAMSIRFLRKFGWATQNVMHGCDVALLLSTRFGSLGGVAWLRAMCRSYNSFDSSGSYGYANISGTAAVTNFPAYSWNVMVLSHELGHMVGSPHTHACVWNPPARNTAIDGCYTLEGSCAVPSPANPAGGGTIMSYCHLTSVGINFSRGFGKQPGDTIRRYIRQRFAFTSTAFPTCGADYLPNTVLSTSNKKLVANRECTDITGSDTTTYYWFDRNTAAHEDDTLVLIIKKNSNNIGNMDSTGFYVETGTGPLYGSGRADTMGLPGGTTGISPVAYAMRRYWRINATATPSTPVTVLFPITAQDTTDIDGSVPGATSISNLKMFTVNAPTNPDPRADSVWQTSPANVKVYSYGTPSTDNWGITTVGTSMYATMKMTNLKCGGTGVYNSTITSVATYEKMASAIRIFPNPTNSVWNIAIDGLEREELTMELYSTDGRKVHTQTLKGATTNIVTTSLPSALYLYRIVGGANVYTGTITKE